MQEAARKKSMQAEEEAHALIKALTADFEKEYGEEKLPKEVAVWLGVLEMPRKLVKSGDPRIDLIVSTLFDLARSMDKEFGAFVASNDEMEELLENKNHCVEKKEALEKAATEAREKVQRQSQYQRTLQANAARAISEFRGSREATEASKREWQVLIGAAAHNLIKVGTEYSKAFAEAKLAEKKLSSLNKSLKSIMAIKEAKRPFVVDIIDRWQSTVAEVDVIIRTMYEVEDSWPFNEKVLGSFKKLEAILRIKDGTRSRQERRHPHKHTEKQPDLPGANLIR